VVEPKNYQIPFFEPHLKEVLEETLGNSFFLDVPFHEAIKNSNALFLSVGTSKKVDGSADLTYLLHGIEQILNVNTEKFQVIIAKFTLPPSTLFKEVIPFVNQKLAENPNRKVGFAPNPEFLRDGYCWEDFIEPDRVVIGGEDEKFKEILDGVFQPFGAPIHYVNYNTAEFIKYLSNTLVFKMISYSNEMFMIAGAIGNIEVKNAFRILHEDKRWFGQPAGMKNYVYPGCGYRGYCLPKDTAALISVSEENEFSPALLKANLQINKEIKPFLVEQIVSEVDTNSTLGILGLSFKPNSDDVRITPTKEIIEQLSEKGYSKIFAYDPISNEEFKSHYPELAITYTDSLDQLFEKVDSMVLLTGWDEVKSKKEQLQNKKVFDFRFKL
jgi:UDPglucose 6-dehydrogenase